MKSVVARWWWSPLWFLLLALACPADPPPGYDDTSDDDAADDDTSDDDASDDDTGDDDAGDDDVGDDDASDDDTGDDDTCVPDCSAALCGGDDGCGNPCVGGYRDKHGAISDCRLNGNCGCGVEPNDNMECTGSGLCRVRCSCDCLPPIDKDPATVAGLDFGGSCTLVFSESGDASVWDYTANLPLCPTDYDPQGPARCIECPPCHRPHPPECDWAAWCTCTQQPWYPQYSKDCCNAGPQYCY